MNAYAKKFFLKMSLVCMGFVCISLFHLEQIFLLTFSPFCVKQLAHCMYQVGNVIHNSYLINDKSEIFQGVLKK